MPQMKSITSVDQIDVIHIVNVMVLELALSGDIAKEFLEQLFLSHPIILIVKPHLINLMNLTRNIDVIMIVNVMEPEPVVLGDIVTV